MLWDALAVGIWATYAALLGYVGGKTFEDNHTLAFGVAFGLAITGHCHHRDRALVARWSHFVVAAHLTHRTSVELQRWSESPRACHVLAFGVLTYQR